MIKDGATYKMWYHGGNSDGSVYAIGYATSPDGITWTKYAGNPVMSATPSTWESDNMVYWPRVIKTGVNAYVMYYTSNNQIGRATSSDGIAWTKTPANPVIAQDWEGMTVRSGSVLFDGSTYRMWFHSSGPDISRIGLATSTDGIAWTMHPANPVLQYGTPNTWGSSTVSISSGGSGSSLDGLTITGAQSCQEGAGGVSVNDAVATVTYSKIRNNEAAGGCGGGGIGAIGSQADLTLEYSDVYQNNASDGGGVMSWDGANVTMRYTEVYSNSINGFGGGGVEVSQNGARLLMEYCSIHNNDSGNAHGGGIYAKDFASFVITDSVVEYNHSNYQGGGLYIENGQAQADRLELNVNSAGQNGGGAWVQQGASLTLSHSQINDNSSGRAGRRSGAPRRPDSCWTVKSWRTLPMTGLAASPNSARAAAGR